MSTLKVNTIRHTGASSDAVTLASDGSCTVKATNNLSNRNLAHNGAMQVSQRGNGSFTSTSSEVGIDRYTMSANSSFNFDKTATREAITSGPAGFQYALKMTPDSVVTPGGGKNGVIKHVLEGQDVQSIGYGTSSCKEVTVSFYAKSASQNNNHVYSIQLMHYDSNDNARYWIKPFTVTSSWQRFSITFSADTTGLVRNDTARGLKVVWGLANGPDDLQSESTAWVQNNAHKGITGQSNFMDNTSNEFWMTGVQIETGDVATDFEHRSYADELARCMRYFELLTYNSTTNIYARKPLLGNGTNTAIWYPTYKVVKRTEPSLITENHDSGTVEMYNYSTSGSLTLSSVNIAEGDEYSGQLTFTATSGISAGNHVSWRWTSSETAWIAMSAEL